ncbi:wrt-6 [Pristionchus pacificus]|uniref:Wrt-6 n=1 Tax=Pristionchus pacificus TaxID=54126 RepID=A0A2A6CBB0_PRIPA|nr:wrt-6 [Pristionchus pacificus]|eukprot:PDM75390.1 wrt-6 [Pristionchus pacificus]
MLLPHILSTLLLLIIQVNTDDLPCIFSPNNVSSTRRSCNKFNHTDGPVLVSRRRFRRQAGRSGLGGCGNTEIKSIMERVMPPLLNSRRQMKIGDIAKTASGSGYPGQQPFARIVEPPTSQVGGLNAGQAGSGNLGQAGRGNLGESGRGNFGEDSQGGDSDQSGRQSGGPGGRGGLGGCGNPEIKSIMERVMPPLLNSGRRMKIGDIAKRLQTAVQQATGKSFEIFMGKGDMTVATHLMEDGSSCRQRVGEFYTTVYETPVQYDIFNLEQEQFLSNIDFGEPLGGSGYPGQEPFPHLVQAPGGEAGTNANALGDAAGEAGSEQSERGRANAEPDGGPSVGGCDNAQLRGIMNRVVPPLLNAPQRMRIGDIARRLQLAVQQETGKSFEIFMGPSEMTFSSHQMSAGTSCRQQIGEYYTTVYETPVQYNIFDAAEEQFMANIDFGQELGSTGYPGQIPFPQYTELAPVQSLQGPLWPQYYPPVAANPPVYYSPPPVFAQMECFSADLMVETIEGPKRMDELKTGDEVLSIDETMISFSPIVMFLHRDEQLMAEFNVITTANGKSVKLTNEHLIFVSDCDIKNTLRLVKAKEVTIDHCVMSSQTSKRTLNVDRVTNITKVYERGIYSPLTSTGDIIVNDILSSCHSNLGVRTLQQSVFIVYRILYRSLSFFLPEEGSLPVGLEYLSSTLDLFLPAKGTLS